MLWELSDSGAPNGAFNAIFLTKYNAAGFAAKERGSAAEKCGFCRKKRSNVSLSIASDGGKTPRLRPQTNFRGLPD